MGGDSYISISLTKEIWLIQQAEGSDLKILESLFIISTAKVSAGFFKNLEIEWINYWLPPG